MKNKEKQNGEKPFSPGDHREAASSYHIPVLLNEVIEFLNIKPDGTYVDCTFGGRWTQQGNPGKTGKPGKAGGL